jgi:hypothetical protein
LENNQEAKTGNGITRGESDEPPSYDENSELLTFQGLVNPGETQNGIAGSVEHSMWGTNTLPL